VHYSGYNSIVIRCRQLCGRRHNDGQPASNGLYASVIKPQLAIDYEVVKVGRRIRIREHKLDMLLLDETHKGAPMT
jgi:hypothetical protein